MRLGMIQGTLVRCSLCGMEMRCPTPMEAERTLGAHLNRVHARHPLLMERTEHRAEGKRMRDPPDRIEVTGPRWKGDLAAGGS